MAILSPKRRLEIEREAREVFEMSRRMAQDLCGDEVGPRGAIPVQTGRIISKLGIQVRRDRDLPNQRGLITAGRFSGTEVLISEDQSPGAKRFTEAHEIGHIRLHPGEMHLRERSDGQKSRSPLKEQEADFFAANLTMPRELIIEEFTDRFGRTLSVRNVDDDQAHALTNGKFSPSQIRKMNCKQFAELIAESKWFSGRYFDSMKDVFGVSREAMVWRLIELRLVSE
jgi:Zn-dependent peptidase ImmA (M78 family)